MNLPSSTDLPNQESGAEGDTAPACGDHMLIVYCYCLFAVFFFFCKSHLVISL